MITSLIPCAFCAFKTNSLISKIHADTEAIKTAADIEIAKANTEIEATRTAARLAEAEVNKLIAQKELIHTKEEIRKGKRHAPEPHDEHWLVTQISTEWSSMQSEWTRLCSL
jgi:hypothetical protein